MNCFVMTTYVCMYVCEILLYAVYRGRGDSSREKMLVFHFGLKAAGLYRMAEAALPLLPAHLCPSLPQQRGEEPEEEGEEDET